MKTIVTAAIVAVMFAFSAPASACGPYAPSAQEQAEAAVWVAIERAKASRHVTRVDIRLVDGRRAVALVSFGKKSKPLRLRVINVDGSWRVA